MRPLQTVTGAVGDLASDALPTLTHAARVVGPVRLTPVDGRIDLAPPQALARCSFPCPVCAVTSCAVRTGCAEQDDSVIRAPHRGPVVPGG
ncbi:hypothetical protein SAMN05216467_2372 [Cellulomonas sp. KH9]|nr:hypothetical protein SAMN05216467_2372 [Cellulomonas sp. KH9]